MENIKETYEKVLKVGEISEKTIENIQDANTKDIIKLSDSEIEEINDTLNDIIDKNANLKVLSQLPSNNGISESDGSLEGEDVLMNVKVNPATNEKIILGPVEEDENELSSELFDDILNGEAEGTDFTDINFRKETVETAMKDKFKGTSFSDTDILKIVNVLNEYRKDKNIDVYSNLPDKLKSIIDRGAASSGIPINVAKNVRKTVSKELMEDLMFDISLENYQLDFMDEVNDLFDNMNKEIKDMSIDMTKNQIENLTNLEPKMREKDPKLADRLLLIIDGMKNSFSFERLYNAVKERKIGKIRKIDLEKPEKIYKNFNRLYETSVYNIYDIGMLPNILRKKLPDTISNEDIHRFVISFCKYCENEKLKPEVLEEHSYMYYTILNIVMMNIGNKSEKEDQFEEEILNNITKVIELF